MVNEAVNWSGTIAGWISLVMSCISLYLNIAASRTNQDLMRRLLDVNERESDRVDQLIRALTRSRRRR